MSTSPRKPYRPETKLVHSVGPVTADEQDTRAIYLTQGFVYDNAASAERRFKNEEPGYQYTRFGNPTITTFLERITELEGAQTARATSTGPAAVTAALMGQLRAGDHCIATRTLYGACRYIVENYLPRFGVATTLVDGTDLNQWKRAVRPNTRTLFLESPTNPTLSVIDIAAVAEIAHAAGATLVVDNVYATPLYQRPLQLGADCVVYSASNHIDGQGRCLGGVVLGSEKFIQPQIHTFIRQTGPSLSPFNAWALAKGLETLEARVRKQTETAAAVADALSSHPRVKRVIYPGRTDHPQAKIAKQQMSGGSTLVAFEIKGGKNAAFRLQDSLKLIRISDNLNDAKSLIIHPASTTHQDITPTQRAVLGIGDGLLRFSAGLEHQDDVIDDLTAALAAM